ncbi:peptidoglycan binding domain protein [Candidatus Burkholderia verschuerenii]|uniref:Peptidoglycan binding domain protein n=1 Tax=Candidatus Burkholderia verschuerenii TaxID=242163 RepID=A0A0L0MCU3_9BURK|nr:DUF2235 domain-containing protein [Candidatus Burkholderia verschuerenii]KND59804.1 peptidoglycan binding domain protein [Candidatus Burkholderia verschuerenii]
MNAAKNLVLFIDGTWSAPHKRRQTNVRKLFEVTVHATEGLSPQLAYYLPGVGTDIKASVTGDSAGYYKSNLSLQQYAGAQTHASMRWLLGGAFGEGTAARIKEAYAFLCSEYDSRRGDRVFIFEFSRGAFAARSLAGFINEVGILLRNKMEFLEAAYQLYESPSADLRAVLQPFIKGLAGKTIQGIGDDPDSILVHFLGTWDTVGAMGLPGRMSRFTADRTEYHEIDLPPNVMKARHAMAIHEQQKAFEVLQFRRKASHRDIVEVWLPGAHADVGGGYADGESGLSGIAFRWMLNEAAAAGLNIEECA